MSDKNKNGALAILKVRYLYARGTQWNDSPDDFVNWSIRNTGEILVSVGNL